MNLAASGRKKTSPSILKNEGDNFWNLYEKNLGIVKEEPKEKSNSKIGSKNNKSSKEHAESSVENFNLKIDENESQNKMDSEVRSVDSFNAGKS